MAEKVKAVMHDDELSIERRSVSAEHAEAVVASVKDGEAREQPVSEVVAFELDRYADGILSELRSLNAYLESRL